MAGIHPISSSSPIGWNPSAQGASNAGPAGSAEAKKGFGDALKNYISDVDQEQQTSSQAIEDLLTGRQKDVLPVVAAVAKADMSFKLLVGVRNKVIEAYKQTMNIQL